MKTNQLSTILFFCILGIFWSCSESLDDKAPQDQTIANANIRAQIDEGVDIRTLNDTTTFKSANSVPATEIDTSQYAIHIKDHYGDIMFLNELGIYNAPANYRGYEGVFINNNIAYKASATYNINNKEFSAVLPYKYNIVFLYQCSWKTPNYFEGAFCYMMEYSTSNYPNRLRSIKCSVLKGSFPGMND